LPQQTFDGLLLHTTDDFGVADDHIGVYLVVLVDLVILVALKIVVEQKLLVEDVFGTGARA
tara:strand:+ start:249 stop:431 length:183 start_codon:yes stop_codon:yes gene_type:complete